MTGARNDTRTATVAKCNISSFFFPLHVVVSMDGDGPIGADEGQYLSRVVVHRAPVVNLFQHHSNRAHIHTYLNKILPIGSSGDLEFCPYWAHHGRLRDSSPFYLGMSG